MASLALALLIAFAEIIITRKVFKKWFILFLLFFLYLAIQWYIYRILSPLLFCSLKNVNLFRFKSISVSMHMCAHMWRPDVDTTGLPLLLCLVFETGSLTGSRAQWLARLNDRITGPIYTSLSALGLQKCTAVPGFYVGGGTLKAGACDCTASILPAMLALVPKHYP